MRVQEEFDEMVEGTTSANGADLLGGRVLLGGAIEKGVEPPDELVEDVLLRGRVHNIFAPPGSGKTFLALYIVRRVIEAGEKVLVFDAENGLRIIAERLSDLGADPALVDENLVYLPFPSLSLTNESTLAYERTLDGVKPALVIFDSWLTFLAGAGLDENSSTDVASWSVAYAQPARRRRIAVLLLDRVLSGEQEIGRVKRVTQGEKAGLWVPIGANGNRLPKSEPMSRNKAGQLLAQS